MAAKGYVPNGHTDVEAYLGTALTPAGVVYEQELEHQVEDFIDGQTHQQWNVAPVLNERYSLARPGAGRTTIFADTGQVQVRLRQRPVASVEAIRVRTDAPGDQLKTLTPITGPGNGDYELLDAASGQVIFSGGYGGSYKAWIDYTPARPVPGDISRAAVMIVAHSMLLSLYPERLMVSEVKLATGEDQTFDQGAFMLSVPPLACTTLTGKSLPGWLYFPY